MTPAQTPERDELALAMLAAWLNVRPDQIPAENRAHTCSHTMAAWKRVGEAARQSAAASSRAEMARLVEALHLAASRLQVASVDAMRAGETRLSADCITWANDATRAALSHRSEGEG